MTTISSKNVHKKLENHKSTKNSYIKSNIQSIRKVKGTTPQSYPPDVTLDSSSPIHLTNRKDWLTQYKPVHGKMNYSGVGKNGGITIIGHGLLHIKNGDQPDIPIECYYSTDDDVTILSLEKLRKETGYNILLDDGIMVNKNNLIKISSINNTVWTSSTLLITKPNYNIRVIRPLNPLIPSHAMSIEESHYRLQHVSKEAIEQSVKKKLFADITELTDKDQNDCKICLAGKAKRHSHYQGSMNHYYQNKDPGSSWSLDMFGPLPIKNAKSDRYLLVMVDNVSRYIIGDTTMDKDGTKISNIIQNNIRRIEKRFGHTVKELVMDRGTEFTDKMGITCRFSSIQDHAANARAEKTIQTITLDTRTLLLQNKLKPIFWKYAVQAAINARNCVCNKQIDNAPIKLLSKDNIEIYLKSFLPFGAPATI